MISLERLGFSGMVRVVHTGLLGTALWASAPSAYAQSDSAAARALFAEARSLMDDERFEQACPKLEESLRLDHGMGTQFNLAHCWEKMGRTASAWALFLDVAAAARAGNQPQRETAARERAKVLEAKLTRLRIDVSDASPGTEVERDGQDVRKASWGTGVPVDPGKHVVRVSAPGKQTWSDEVDVPASARTFTVTVPALTDAPIERPEVQAEAEAEAAHAAPVEADVPRSSGGGINGQRVAALVVGGVGLAAAATGTIFAIQSRSDNSEALKLCRTPDPDNGGVESCATPEEQRRWGSLVDAAERGRLIGYIGIGVGGAALLTAVVLYATAGDDPPERASLELQPLWADGLHGAAITGRF
jgi:hypothetical protein